jgi:hydrogenase maturation factor
LVIGSLIGEVEKEKLVLSSGAKENDLIILTKGIFIEGTSIIAREKEKELKQKGNNDDFIEKCKNYLYNPGISVFTEALTSNDNFPISAMHDLTEGGLFCGLAELAIASKLGLLIKKDLINILPEPQKLSEIFKINPYNTISSGSLLISTNNKYSEDLIDLLRNSGIDSAEIGKFTSKKGEYLILDENHQKSYMKYSEIDEITKIV